MKTLAIVWQRLVDKEGQTCDRCRATEVAVERAVQQLDQALRHLGIRVVLEKRELAPAEFRADPLESNRIWLAGKPLEDWLSATPWQSPCCSVCGEFECRTITVDGRTYEAVPANLIVKAGLLAAATLIDAEEQPGCCSPGMSVLHESGCCRPSDAS